MQNSLPTIKEALKAVAAIPGQPTETVVLDGASNNQFHVSDRYFNKDNTCDLQFPNLRRISVRQNWLEEVSLDVLACMPSLQAVNMGFNPMTITDTPWNFLTQGTQKYWMSSNITQLGWSYWSYDPMSPHQNTFQLLYCPEDGLETNLYFRSYQLKYNDDLIEIDDVKVEEHVM